MKLLTLNCPQMFFKIGVLRKFAIFTGKHLHSSFNETAGLKTRSIIEKRLKHRCLHVNIAKYLRTAFYIEHLWGCFCQILMIFLGRDFFVQRKNGNARAIYGI